MFNPNKNLITSKQPDLTELFQIITETYSVNEHDYIDHLIAFLNVSVTDMHEVTQETTLLIQDVRNINKKGLTVSIDAFLQQYNLETEEGIILMCLAEALLRIPDKKTADALIEDKFSGANWKKYFSKSESMLVNASTWGLMLTGKIININKKDNNEQSFSTFKKMLNKLGEPVIRKAMYTAMKIMGNQFVLGKNIKEALKNSKKERKNGYTHSYDMLGEEALTQKDAQKYLDSYKQAIETLIKTRFDLKQSPAPSISIKLSALHPRYTKAQEERVLSELYQSVLELIHLAKPHQISITIDAEEMDRLELSLKLFEKLFYDKETVDYPYLGLVVQAYSKRALPVLHWLHGLAKYKKDTVIPVRLVKGAYWDTEIKQSQVRGLTDYPVFTRKSASDISYLACAQYLLSAETQKYIYPQFATHNAHTVMSILNIANPESQFEFQRLHGMGEELYSIIKDRHPHIAVRIYAPVGAHEDLLPYLVRRLLENGANTSFVHKLIDEKTPIESLTTHPIVTINKYKTYNNDKIPIPEKILYLRNNSKGVNLNIESEHHHFMQHYLAYLNNNWLGQSIIDGKTISNDSPIICYSPAKTTQKIGTCYHSTHEDVITAIDSAHHSFHEWNNTDYTLRAEMINTLSNLLESHKHELIALCTLEAGKTLQDGIDEVREAIDFCRYYSQQAHVLFKESVFQGPTGEKNSMILSGRGCYVCISQWNFPLAIFLGQIVAALVTGNTVVAKPAEQTSLIATYTAHLIYEANIPKNVFHLVLGKGSQIGDTFTTHPSVAGVCFTGSTATAKHIYLNLANKQGAITQFVAETGGQNAMIADSTALPEQLTKDVVASAFQSAGQRCSALRVLYLQEDIADKIIVLIKGAMDELHVGIPEHYRTDIGPVIDKTALSSLNQHIQDLIEKKQLLHQSHLSDECNAGYFISPTLFELKSINELKKEHFGPILHIIKYKAKDIDKVIQEINNTGYGLTFGIHSRNASFVEYVYSQIHAGNIYINRNQIGAVVGVQPFGGQGLSGTGPKAGGPFYLHSFIHEKTISNNITAIGGNTTLLSLNDNEFDNHTI